MCNINKEEQIEITRFTHVTDEIMIAADGAGTIVLCLFQKASEHDSVPQNTWKRRVCYHTETIKNFNISQETETNLPLHMVFPAS